MKNIIVFCVVLLQSINLFAQNGIEDFFFPDESDVKYYTEDYSFWEMYLRQGNHLVRQTGMDDVTASKYTQELLIYSTSIVVSDRQNENMVLLKLPEPGKSTYWQNKQSDGNYDNCKAELKMLEVGTEKIEVIEVINEHIVEGNRFGSSAVQYWGKGYGLLMDAWTPSMKYYHPLLLNNYYRLKDYESLEQTANSYPLHRDGKKTPASLQSFIDRLVPVLKKRDTKEIRNFLGYDILEKYDANLTYNENLDEYFGRFLHDPDSKAWDELYTAISAGGYLQKSDEYIFPWYGEAVWDYTGQWNEEKEIMENKLIEGHEAAAIVGDNVRVREKPDVNSEIKGTLAWQAVRVDREYVEKGHFYADNDWFKISTVNNELEGYVSADFVFTPSDARVIVEQDIVKYLYDGKRFTKNGLLKHLLKTSQLNYPQIMELFDSDQYLLPESEWQYGDWVITGFSSYS